MALENVWLMLIAVIAILIKIISERAESSLQIP